jgi:hypothetical protein
MCCLLVAAAAAPQLRAKLTWGHDDNHRRAFLMVYAGRISVEKGLGFCIELLRRLREQHGTHTPSAPCLPFHFGRLPH